MNTKTAAKISIPSAVEPRDLPGELFADNRGELWITFTRDATKQTLGIIHVSTGNMLAEPPFTKVPSCFGLRKLPIGATATLTVEDRPGARKEEG